MTNKAFIPYSINLPTNSEEGSLDGVAKRSTSLGVFDEIPTCNFAPKISVSACYASYANQYLVLQRKVDQMWGVPDGKVKGDESPLDAVLREFLEETGINSIRDKVGTAIFLSCKLNCLKFAYNKSNFCL